MIIIFLDDQDIRHTLAEKYLSVDHTILHAWNYHEMIGLLNSCQKRIGLIMFDRSLGDYIEENGKQIERTGHDVIHYMRDNIASEKYPAMAIVHSYDPQAKDMAEDLNKMGINTRQIPFSGDMLKVLVQKLRPQ